MGIMRSNSHRISTEQAIITGTVITEKGPCQKSTCFQVQVLITILNPIK